MWHLQVIYLYLLLPSQFQFKPVMHFWVGQQHEIPEARKSSVSTTLLVKNLAGQVHQTLTRKPLLLMCAICQFQKRMGH